ncbi:glycerol-3-phosphate 1-O-acyltransferase PlsY [Pseudovibrio sp. Tun.PSC04-5.I4]|uniref:glycerol-3-phosphate 1-O-acyltransferase PlsY n=1 Tax=Pseudovibrio sp. Tun.PSC04-5.I4 TaxID=1798213 RepID=UPI0008893DE1|nr:glycerol-3-phosphate 1-O-acyltransferase PlsY [Pseudovibrio sp. Tun.PSC04-5.I4]SDR39451.1 glycerol-3-phosphate acyltransferase PlsY [Pseudovibrio sp. Tun.PSC04-5.I4]
MPEPISWSLDLPYYLAALAFGYVLGSIPFGLLFTKMAGHGDIRNIGSGNIGTTNVLRTGSKKLAALTLLCDALKATLAVVLVKLFMGGDIALVAGLGAFLGHLFPIWLKFKGGKGVATYIGILLGVFWPVGVIFIAIWIVTAYITKYSSMAALVASLVTPFILLAFDQWQIAQMMGVLSVILWAKHHENITRLLKGNESKIGSKG